MSDVQPEPTNDEPTPEQDNLDSTLHPDSTTETGPIHELHQYHDRLVQNTFITELWPVLMSRPEIALVLYRKLQAHYAVPDFN